MPQPISLETERLRLRPWRRSDLVPFAYINADPDVMRYFPSTLSAEESDAVAERIIAHFDTHGFGFWAVEVPGGPEFIGFVGLNHCLPPLPFVPAVEIGWRLATAHQGLGYATEAAQSALDFAFDSLRLNEIVAYTTVNNTPSRNVMHKLGMTRDPRDDFGHPRIPTHHPLHPHVVYRVRSPR